VAAVQELRVLLANASDVNKFRRIGRDVMGRVNQMFTWGYPAPVRATHWEYEQDIPGLSPRGQIADRSREIVGQSHLVMTILGPRLGEITKEEVKATLELRRDGTPKELLVLRWRGKADAAFAELERDVLEGFNEEPRCADFGSALEFQALFFTALTAHMLGVASPSYAPVNVSLA
jgi:hypothetical protein